MNIFLTKTLTGFVPADEEARQALRKYKVGDTLRADIKKPRCYVHHKQYFALLNLTFENQDKYTNFNHFRKAVQIAAGHVEELITLEGEVLLEPKSIDYSTLDELEFSVLFGQTMSVCARILGDLDLDELQAEVMRYAA
jgi:hypothetical protein